MFSSFFLWTELIELLFIVYINLYSSEKACYLITYGIQKWFLEKRKYSSEDKGNRFLIDFACVKKKTRYLLTRENFDIYLT